MNLRLSLPVQLVIVIAFVLLFGNMLGEQIARTFYTFSVLFKEGLSFLLPFIVFAFVLSGILSFKKNAPVVLGIMLSMIFCSNAAVALFVYLLVSALLPLLKCTIADVSTFNDVAVIEPFFRIQLPTFIKSEYAMVIAVALGLFFSFVSFPPFEISIKKFKNFLEKILNYTVIPLLPIYVLGFLLKIRYEGMFVKLMQQYGSTVTLIVAVQMAYLLFMYFLANGFNARKAMKSISIALPSYLTAFSTMSSTATIPVSVDAAEQNTGNEPLSEMAMPIMANVHLLGDSVSTPTLAMVTMAIFLGCLPNFVDYVGFVFYFCTSMFAVSGIPGGGIIVMIPILKSLFGFTNEMISIITALYLLMDPFGTSANVMGDGALVIMVNNVLKRLGIMK